MEKKQNNTALQAMFRRWIYMAVAIAASILLLNKPVFSFQEDIGIIYVRSFSMNATTFFVTQTELRTGAQQIVSTRSVHGLYYCAIILLIGSSLCFLCFFDERWRTSIAIITAVVAGIYYIFLVYYAIIIAQDYYATLYPNIVAIMPALILEAMLLVRRNIARSFFDADSDEEEIAE